MMTVKLKNPYIPRIVERLKEIQPAKVILFGSHAQDTSEADSDLDLLVVTNSDELPQTYRDKERIYLEVARLLRDIRGETAVDLIVQTRPMYARFVALDSYFTREVLQKGILLYESDNA